MSRLSLDVTRSTHGTVVRCFRSLLTIVLLSIASASAYADVRATVIATDPPGPEITLGRDQSLYVRIRYATDHPVSIWARPYLDGKEVDVRSNASIPHSGEGEALGWFSFIHPGEVDEIRILAGDGSRSGTHQVSRYALRVTGTAAAAASAPRPEWVDALSQQENEVRRADYERRMREPVTPADSAFMSGFMLAMLALLAAGLAWPAWGLWKWRGGWRLASAIPIAVMGFVVLRIVVGTARDPTSHNLWPFEIIMWGAASVIAMAALKLARRFVGSDA